MPVPRTVFHTTPAAPAREGLKAEYFANTDFSGKPVLTRIDPQIQFDWNAAAPAPGVPMKAFAVRWTGTLTPPGPGDYTFSVPTAVCGPASASETFQVYLDGKLVSTNRLAAQSLDKAEVPGHFPGALRRHDAARLPAGICARGAALRRRR